ncbi:hypothetical protein LZ30DRAFT_220631 [Colletotrichum cereale]|nr:hypothetical protein LZ30DRAFT_220631 [Colletotrichum cereale]
MYSSALATRYHHPSKALVFSSTEIAVIAKRRRVRLRGYECASSLPHIPIYIRGQSKTEDQSSQFQLLWLIRLLWCRIPHPGRLSRPLSRSRAQYLLDLHPPESLNLSPTPLSGRALDRKRRKKWDEVQRRSVPVPGTSASIPRPEVLGAMYLGRMALRPGKRHGHAVVRSSQCHRRRRPGKSLLSLGTTSNMSPPSRSHGILPYSTPTPTPTPTPTANGPTWAGLDWPEPPSHPSLTRHSAHSLSPSIRRRV